VPRVHKLFKKGFFMKFFIDTANLAQIKEANELGILDGVTTNPSLMAKEGIKGEAAILNHYKTICEMVNGDISAEVISTDFDGIVAEGKKLAAIHPNIVVKVPMIKDGIKAIKWFSDHGIRTNCTLVFSAGQAILCAKAGAAYVSPFIGRIDDSGWDGVQLIEQIVHIYSVQNFKTEVLAASIRNPNHIIRCAEAGADVCTCPLDSILGLLKHPLTDIGLAKFLEDAKKTQ
jgi:transaldolase